MEQAELSARERRFTEAFLETGDPAAAAAEAGCGSGRAARALLRGDLRACLGHNLLALPLGLLCGGVLGWEYLRVVFPGLGLKKARLPDWCGAAALALLLGFALLRNLPAFAFLAPSS